MDNYWIGHKVWIVLAPFRAMSYFKDTRYLPGAPTLENERLKIQAKATCCLCKVGLHLRLNISGVL